LFFASDFKNTDEEFQKITVFTKPINAKLEVYHYDYKSFLNANKNKFDKISKKHQSESVTFYSRKLDSGTPLLDHLEKDIAKAKTYWTIVKDLDATDKQAEAFFKKYGI
jgi:hypothetical protein